MTPCQVWVKGSSYCYSDTMLRGDQNDVPYTLVVTAQLGVGLNLCYNVMCISWPLWPWVVIQLGSWGLMRDINHCWWPPVFCGSDSHINVTPAAGTSISLVPDDCSMCIALPVAESFLLFLWLGLSESVIIFVLHSFVLCLSISMWMRYQFLVVYTPNSPSLG